jgi:protein TonB
LVLFAAACSAPLSGGAKDAAARATDGACEFPAEANTKGIDSAVVVVQIMVEPTGAASDVRVLVDPGHGFAEAAKACAMAQTYVPARDRHGVLIPGWTPAVSLRFVR